MVRRWPILGLETRAGLHTGEVEVFGEKIGGIAVHIGARVSALADPGEVLVSRTVVDLVSGSDIEFKNRGEHELKGVPGRGISLPSSFERPMQKGGKSVLVGRVADIPQLRSIDSLPNVDNPTLDGVPVDGLAAIFKLIRAPFRDTPGACHTRRSPRLGPRQSEEAGGLNLAGQSLANLSERFGDATDTVTFALRRAGVTLRSRQGWVAPSLADPNSSSNS